MNMSDRPGHDASATSCGLADPDFKATLQHLHHLAAVGCRGDGRIVFWNQGAERFFGYQASQALSATLQDLMRTAGQRVWARTILDPQAALPTHRAVLPVLGGASAPCLINASRVASDDGSWTTYVLVTPLELPPAMATASPGALRTPVPPCDEALGVLAGGIAHDFNNLLLGMMGNADLLLMELSADHPNRDLVEQITQAGLRAADLCRQLMAFSGSTTIHKESVDINGLVRHLAPLAHMSLGAVPLSLDLAPDLPSVEGDATQLRQVCLNLLTNATEAIAGRPEGAVTIRTRLRPRDDSQTRGSDQFDGAFALIEVEDNGNGMVPEQIERAFDPFYTTKFLGRGLGLAAAQGIVRSHGGTIALCSSPDTGTRVTVTLPVGASVSAQDTAPPAVDRATSATGNGHRILVVDDEAHVRAVTSGLLRRAGNMVLTAEHGAEALALLADDPGIVDLVLLDMTMPGLGGSETLERIREMRPDLPVLLSSGYGPEQSSHLVSRDPRCSFLAKPYRREQLMIAIAELMAAE